ncbi:MAG: DUF4272 domain-containing protein [Thermomicrobiales bacterium]
MRRQRPADDAARPGIEDRGQEAVGGRQPDVGQVGYPRLVGALEVLAAQQVDVSTPVGKIDTDRRAESAWQGEALAVLVWALGQGALAPPGELPDLPAVLAAIPAPWERTASFVSSATLRSESEIAAAREQGELWHWRSTVESLRREATASERREYDDLIREVALESYAAEVLPRTQSGDFEVKREAVKSLSTAALAALIASSAERLRALNWICGFGNSWDSVPLDV